mmetsp:Transcript_15510/g.32058  ORF Transcript_15510/g.32058 Transcript_15510/m.32058 type:complete len:206 (-) Transcript_15510:1377-1994(-)
MPSSHSHKSPNTTDLSIQIPILHFNRQIANMKVSSFSASSSKPSYTDKPKTRSRRGVPAPPSRRPNIAERISMLQMATMSHSGYLPKGGTLMAFSPESVLPTQQHQKKNKQQLQNNKTSKAASSKSASWFGKPNKKGSASQSRQNAKTKKTSGATTKIMTTHRTRIAIRCVDSHQNNKRTSNDMKQSSLPAEDVWIQLVKNGSTA